MMEDFDIPLRRAPVAETPIASGGGIYGKIHRHSRSDFEVPSIDNHEVVLVLQGCGMARRTLSDGRKHIAASSNGEHSCTYSQFKLIQAF
jgi:hypothetical protein